MIIQVDQEGKEVIEMFCDMALKTGGMQNRVQINLVIDSTVVIPKPASKKKPKKKKPVK